MYRGSILCIYNNPDKLPYLYYTFTISTPRRSKAERESRRKAMQERARKGLLSEAEKLAFAAEEAERAQHGEDDKKECVIM